jgi:hypothetical protein
VLVVILVVKRRSLSVVIIGGVLSDRRLGGSEHPEIFLFPNRRQDFSKALAYNSPLTTCYRMIRCIIISSRDTFWSWSPSKLPFTLFYPAICVFCSFVELLSHPAISPLDCAGSCRPSSQNIFHDVCDIHGQG